MPVKIFGTGNVRGYSIDPVRDLRLTKDDGIVTISWSDPDDTVINGRVASAWDGTKIVRKTGGYPTGINDGFLVVDSKVKNQYSEEGFVDASVENDVTYYYSAFAYSRNCISVDKSANATPSYISRILSENTWAKIKEASETGIAKDLWNIGDEINVSFGTLGTYTCCILDFDHDDKADGSGKAGITFGLKELTKNTYAMYSSTGTKNTWEDSNVRRVLENNFFANMQADAKSCVKSVVKTTLDSKLTETTNDKLFLLSAKEVGDSGSAESASETYPLFSDASSRIKKSGSTASAWWLRTPYANDANRYYHVTSTGSISSVERTGKQYLCFGFCV